MEYSRRDQDWLKAWFSERYPVCEGARVRWRRVIEACHREVAARDWAVELFPRVTLGRRLDALCGPLVFVGQADSRYILGRRDSVASPSQTLADSELARFELSPGSFLPHVDMRIADLRVRKLVCQRLIIAGAESWKSGGLRGLRGVRLRVPQSETSADTREPSAQHVD